MTRTYRFYVNGGISERLLATIRNDFPVTFGSGSVYPFNVTHGIAPDDADYLIDKFAEPVTNFTLTIEESYFDVVLVDKPAGATEVIDDDDWFNTLVERIEEEVVLNTIIVERIDGV